MLNFQNIETAQHQKIKQLNQKMGRRPKQTFLQRKHTDGQQEKEKMLNITNYQRKANQNYEVVPHTSQNGHHQKVYQKKKKNAVCGGKETFQHCCWECNLVQPLWRKVWSFLKKLKLELPYDQENNS